MLVTANYNKRTKHFSQSMATEYYPVAFYTALNSVETYTYL
jgi:hypothetical protein